MIELLNLKNPFYINIYIPILLRFSLAMIELLKKRYTCSIRFSLTMKAYFYLSFFAVPVYSKNSEAKKYLSHYNGIRRDYLN